MHTTHTTDCTVNSRALYVALELSKETWKVALTDGLGRVPRIREVKAGNWQELDAEVQMAKTRFELPADAPIISCYEAGRDGFWIHRWLLTLGWRNHIVDPASIEVNRRKRRAKTDMLDANRIVMALIRFSLGDRHACRMVNTPLPEDEDARHLCRELDGLTAERTSHINRIKGLLFAQGVRIEQIGRNFLEWLSVVRTGDNRPLLPGLRERVGREFERLQLVVRQMRHLEQQRARLFRQALREQGEFPRWQQMAVLLRSLCGIGAHSAMTLATELFGWRDLKNRREVAALAGLTPSPWQSGSSVDEEQGISKAGRGPLRSLLVEIAWGWIQFQTFTPLSTWFITRFANGNSRQRRIGIVALARKLLVALWKFVRDGEIPAEAKFTKDQSYFAYTPSLG